MTRKTYNLVNIGLSIDVIMNLLVMNLFTAEIVTMGMMGVCRVTLAITGAIWLLFANYGRKLISEE